MEDPDSLYRTLCSLETLQSGTKGFFHDFSDTVVDEAGDRWISEIFGKIKSDEERMKTVFVDGKIRDVVLDTLGRVKELYRDKDAGISRNKRLEGTLTATTGHHDKALLLFSQAVLRAPGKGKNKTVDQGFSLSLALLARADTLMALKEYRLALEDLRLAAEEGLPDAARAEHYEKMENCQRLLGRAENVRDCLKLTNELPSPGKATNTKMLSKDVDQLNAPMRPILEFRKPPVPSLSGGSNSKLPGASKLIEIRETQTVGRYAVAAEEIHTGDTLVIESPLAACLLPEFYGSHCQHCFSRLRAPVGCPKCSTVAFCGVKCRDLALSTYHKYECKILALLIGSGMSVLSTLAFRMVTQAGPKECSKMYNKTKKQSIEKEMKMSRSSKRRLRKKQLKESCSKPNNDSLESSKCVDNDDDEENHMNAKAYDLVTLTEKRTPTDFLRRSLMAAFQLRCLQKVGFFENPSRFDESPNKEELIVGALLLRNLQLLQFNAHEVYETRLGNEHHFRGSRPIYLGVAIYPTVAFFNHECYPAVTRYFVGRDIVIRAVRSLKPGDVVAENYGPIFTKKTRPERQRSLAARYWFECCCRACQEDWPDFKSLTNDCAKLRCPTKGCTRLLIQPREPSKSSKCPGCQKKVNLEEHLAKLRECESEYTLGLAIMEAERPEEAVEKFTKALDKFHEIAAPPHRETHLAEIAIATCMASSGNTWRPPTN